MADKGKRDVSRTAASAASAAESEPLGLREEKKGERLSRIKAAARSLFLKRGYDGTTLRMIGAHADIPAATILRYVEDKRDLLYLLFNEDHARVTEEAIAEIRETSNFLDQTVNGFRPYYRYFAKHPDLARCVLREATFFMRRPGNHAYEAATRNIRRITRTVEIARTRGEIRHPASDDQIALLVFELYQIEARRWLLARRPDVRAGLKSLRATLGIIVDGLAHELPRTGSRRTG